CRPRSGGQHRDPVHPLSKGNPMATKTQRARSRADVAPKTAATEKKSPSTTRKNAPRPPREPVEVVPAKPTLDQLAATANDAHRRCFKAGREMVEYAIQAGEALIIVKNDVRHGDWLKWVGEHFEASVDTAENYMLVARNSELVRN